MKQQDFNGIHAYTEAFSQFLFDQLERSYFLNNRTHVFHIDRSCLSKAVTWLTHNEQASAVFMTMTAVDARESKQGFQLHLLFHIASLQLLLTLVVTLDSEKPEYEAITPILPAAEWSERELHDLFGITPKGMELKPLALHRDWPRGKHYPLRHDFSEQNVPSPAEVAHVFSQPDAEGMHQVAVGPVHAGIIEPGHLRFTVTGEQIHQFDAQLFYTHKGIEKMAEGKHYENVLDLAEHVCGMCSFAHGTAFCQSLEALGHLDVPERALRIRTLLLEMERISSHLADLSAMCSAGGFAAGSQWAAYLREHLLHNNQRLTGSRFLRKINVVGGLKRDIPDEALKYALKRLEPFKTQFQEWIELVLNSESFLDRLETSGTLSREQALRIGIVGPAARASGINRDIRRDFSNGMYDHLNLRPPVLTEGDALARLKVRIDEVKQSFECCQKLVETMPQTDRHGVMIAADALFCPGVPSVGVLESAKGELIHWVMMGPGNTVSRWHVRSASYMNWRGMVQATMGNNIVPDGPLVNKSFNLCYACVDR